MNEGVELKMSVYYSDDKQEDMGFNFHTDK